MRLNLACCLFQKMEILPVTDLGMALHDFVNKDDKQAFYACVHQNLDVTQVIS
jgi:double-strand break repair protein MRE11